MAHVDELRLQRGQERRFELAFELGGLRLGAAAQQRTGRHQPAQRQARLGFDRPLGFRRGRGALPTPQFGALGELGLQDLRGAPVGLAGRLDLAGAQIGAGQQVMAGETPGARFDRAASRGGLEQRRRGAPRPGQVAAARQAQAGQAVGQGGRIETVAGQALEQGEQAFALAEPQQPIEGGVEGLGGRLAHGLRGMA